MRSLLPFAFVSVMAVAALADEPHKMAYEKSDAVWVANLDGSAAKKIADGADPDLSPDGTKLTFNTVQPDGNPADRKIAVADLATGQVTIFKDLPSNNCLEPIWSPDGKRILFYYYQNNDMLLGTIGADGSGFHAIFGKDAKPHPYWSAAWARDGASIFCQDMEKLYRIGLDGAVQKSWVIEKIVPRGGMSGNIRLDVSADGKTLLMDVEMDEKITRKGWVGPLPAIWTMDLETDKTTRLTPKTLFAWDAHWLGTDAIVFSSEAAGEKDPSIYRMSLTGGGKDKKLLVKNARIPSVSP